MSNYTQIHKNICRICLDSNSKMFWITNTPLQDIYERLTISKMQQMNLPVTVCCICFTLLKKCCSLCQLAQNSEKILLNLYHSGIEITSESIGSVKTPLQKYTRTPIEIISLSINDQYDHNDHKNDHNDETMSNLVKKELIETSVDKIEVEIENTDFEMKDLEVTSDRDDNIMAFDSEDEIPLKHIKKKTRKKIKENYKKEKEDIQIDAKEVILSKEQQIKDVLDRRKSSNYINSSYKCDLCYKGFMNTVTFNNHMYKHDLSCGTYQCDVCRLRYKTARDLRNHIYKSHSRYYSCNKCGHVSHTFDQAKDHEKWHDGVTYQCKICCQDFKKRTSYLTHVRLMHPTEHVCNMCGHSFIGKNGLMLHKGKAHKREFENAENVDESPKTYCTECNIQFVCLEAIQRHILKSIKHKKWKENGTTMQCLVCDQEFPDKTTLMRHIKEHKRKLLPKKLPEKPPAPVTAPCTECDSVFTSEANLKAHIKTVHLGQKYDKNIVCEVCGVKCKSNAALIYHQRSHTGERPFVCPVSACGRRFAAPHQLTVHTRTHTGETPYSCRVCTKTFKQKTALNRHFRVHTGAKPFTCKLCSKSFSQSNSVKVHVNTVHLKLPSYRKIRKEQIVSKDIVLQE